MPARNMSIDVEVGLISGRRVTVQAAADETVGTLKRRAQTALGVGIGRLLTHLDASSRDVRPSRRPGADW